ncbi:MAG: hypothetical protein K6B43_10755 [Treponema sp.]|nr:hypothetical protein [Treponema sp.]
MSAAEKWALFLKNADNGNSSELVKNLTEKEDGIMNAQSVLSSISSDRGLWLAQYHAEVRERDRISNMEEAKAEARAEGNAEGIKKLAALIQSGLSLDDALRQLGQQTQ